MKKIFLLAALAVLLGVATATAQQIAVVSENGETNVFTTLQAAIEGAAPGSVIYLPGGGFPLPDSVKITKKLTIIGIGHKPINDNVDGTTRISGNLWFNEGSDGSALIGCYLTGCANIGDGNTTVNDILIRCCNLYKVKVLNNTCLRIVVDQNYIRTTDFWDRSEFGNSPVLISNNIMGFASKVQGGEILNNIFVYPTASNNILSTLNDVQYTSIKGNVFRSPDNILSGSNCVTMGNLAMGSSWGEYPIVINDTPEEIFCDINSWAVSPSSNFHFKDAYKQYENQVGVYANGVNFDHQMAPVPYIVAKRIAEETDAAGQLKIQVRVKAGE